MKIEYTATPFQYDFHANKQEEFCAHCQIGGGASTAIAMDAFIFAIEHPGVTCLIAQKSTRDMFSVFRKMLPKEAFLEDSLNSRILLENDSRIYIYNPSTDYASFMALRPEYIGIDRYNFPGTYIKEFIKGRCRDSPRAKRRFREIRANHTYTENGKWKEIAKTFMGMDAFRSDFLKTHNNL